MTYTEWSEPDTPPGRSPHVVDRRRNPQKPWNLFAAGGRPRYYHARGQLVDPLVQLIEQNDLPATPDLKWDKPIKRLN